MRKLKSSFETLTSDILFNEHHLMILIVLYPYLAVFIPKFSTVFTFENSIIS